jgi:hypothetical protein
MTKLAILLILFLIAQACLIASGIVFTKMIRAVNGVVAENLKISPFIFYWQKTNRVVALFKEHFPNSNLNAVRMSLAVTGWLCMASLAWLVILRPAFLG